MNGLLCWLSVLALVAVMAIQQQASTSGLIQGRDIDIKVTGNASESSSEPTKPAGGSAISSNSSDSNINTGNNTSPYYYLNMVDPPNNSKSLQYLYLIFLVFVIIIGGVLLRWCVIKRRKARKAYRRNLLRTGALRMDLERYRESAETLTNNGNEPAMSEVLYFGDDDPRLPPPSYPEAAFLKNCRLPIYDEVSDTQSALHLSSSTAVSSSAVSEPESSLTERENDHGNARQRIDSF